VRTARGAARTLVARSSWRVHPARPLPALGLLRDSERWAPGRLRAFQVAALREVLAAAASAPFYRLRLDEAGLRPESLRSVEDLAALKPLERAELQREGIPGLRVAGRRGLVVATSGSTGRPLRVLRPLELVRWIEAADLRAREWHGIGVGEPRLHVVTTPVPPRRRFVSALTDIRLFHVDRPGLGAAVERLARSLERRPVALVSGSSTCLYVLARELLAQGRQVQARTVWSGANALLVHQRAAVEAALGCPAYDRYGAWETGAIAHECPEARGLHVFAENVLVEVVRPDGSPAAPGETGSVLVTLLHNTAMPIVRYRLGDLAVASDGPCRCGRTLPLLGRLLGRANDLLVRRDGSYVTPDWLAGHVMTAVAESVVEFQVVQGEDLRLHVRVVQRDDPQPGPRRARIAAELDAMLGVPGATTVERVAEIPMTPAGKLRHVVSHAAPHA
jgi:phenylacetate-CoA ligase